MYTKLALNSILALEKRIAQHRTLLLDHLQLQLHAARVPSMRDTLLSKQNQDFNFMINSINKIFIEYFHNQKKHWLGRSIQLTIIPDFVDCNQQMEPQPAEDFDKATASVIICLECSTALYLLPNSDVAVNEVITSFGIIVAKDESYCLRCLQQRIKEQKRQARLHEERFIFYKQLESSYHQQELGRVGNQNTGEEEDRKLNEEIARLTRQQQEITCNLSKIKEETNELKDKIFAFEVEEEKFWEGINKIERRTNKVEEKSLHTKFDKNEGKELLEELSRVSVLHLFTDIVIDDNVALVQGMAMGKRSEGVDISWQEVGIGLGHLLLALNILSMKYTYDYRLIENIKLKGIQSEITLKNKRKRLYVWNSKQNEKQIGELLQILLLQTFYLSEEILNVQNISYTQQFRTPFLVNANECKIAEMYIDPFKMDERIRWNNWTKAMRYFLINFKHMITVYAIKDKYL